MVRRAAGEKTESKAPSSNKRKSIRTEKKAELEVSSGEEKVDPRKKRLIRRKGRVTSTPDEKKGILVTNKSRNITRYGFNNKLDEKYRLIPTPFGFPNITILPNVSTSPRITGWKALLPNNIIRQVKRQIAFNRLTEKRVGKDVIMRESLGYTKVSERALKNAPNIEEIIRTHQLLKSDRRSNYVNNNIIIAPKGIPQIGAYHPMHNTIVMGGKRTEKVGDRVTRAMSIFAHEYRHSEQAKKYGVNKFILMNQLGLIMMVPFQIWSMITRKKDLSWLQSIYRKLPLEADANKYGEKMKTYRISKIYFRASASRLTSYV